METVLFFLYALAACGGALAVVLSQNVVRMAFYLVISLGSTAGLFFLLGADFVGATQILIYVGGTVVLLIFGVMLTSSAPFQSIKSSPGEIAQGAVVGVAFLSLVIWTVLAVDWDAANQAVVQHSGAEHLPAAGYNPAAEGNTARPIGTALLGMRFDKDFRPGAAGANPVAGAPVASGQGAHAGEAVHSPSLSTGYLLPFEIVSVHLLVVLVGAGYLARAKRRAPNAA